MKNIKKVLMFLLIILFSVTLSYAAINSDFYKIDRDNKMISRIGPETDIEAFKQKINVSKIYKSKSDRTEITNGLVGTGMAVIDGQDVYELSIAGDFDGDGKATQVELSKIIRHIVGLKGAKLEGLKYESADLTGDGLVDQRDITKYIKYIVFGELDLGKPNNKPDIEPDTTAPTVTLTTTEPTTSSVTATANATDAETGIDENATYTFYIKEENGEYVQKQNTTSKTCDFTGLKQNTIYTIKVEVEDKAGNKGSAEKTITTGIVPDAGTTEGAITFGTVTWADGQASVNISTNTNYYIEYQVNGTSGTWTKATTPGANITATGLNHDDIVYARLTDGTNAGQYATIEIADATAPTVTLTISGQTTSSVTATANATDAETGIAENAIYTFYIKEENGEYVQKQNTTSKTCNFTGLKQNTTYTIKVEVEDKAGNKGIQERTIQTNGIPDASETTGTITFGNVQWENSFASVQISTNTNYKIEYQVNGTNGTWTKASTPGANITATGLNHDNIVYARLTDGINSGNYIVKTIKDETNPTVTITTSNQTTSSVTAIANATDAETGIDENAIYTFYIKEGNGEYVQKQNTTSKTCDFTGLRQNTIYTIKVEVEDKAGNKGSAEKTITTGIVPDAETTEGTITFGTVTWADGQASVNISTNTNYYIEYQVNGTIGTWTKATTPGANITATGLNHDDIVYARLTDGTNAGQYATVEIADATAPTVTLSTTVSTISSVTATANATDAETGIAENATYTFYIKEQGGEYVQKQNTTSKTCDFTGLKQNTTYTIKVEVEDKAGNKGIQERTIQTSGIPDAGTTEGAIIFGTVRWTDGQASVNISTNTNYYIEYQVNGTSGTWTKATTPGANITATGLNHDDIVYARLTDGTNAGQYATIKIADATAPTVTLSTTVSTISSVTATANATDAETGIDENATYTFYIKEQGGEYVQKQNTTSKTCDFTGLKQNTTYTIKVEVEDKAGNKGIQERTIQTSGIPDAGTTEGAITFGNVRWGTDSTASVEISTNTNYIIEYQVNGTTEEWSQAEGAGESITAILLHHNDVVYARLTDGTYSGNWAELTVKDAVKPSATINLNTNKFVQSENLEATITHIDNETGINFTACRWVVNAYATSIGTNTTHYTGGAFTKNDEKISTQLNSVGTFYLHVLSVDNAGNKKETISDAIIVEEPKTLASQVEVGDYVLYDATNNYSYESVKGTGNTGGNGYGTQTFTSSSDIKWKVLKIEDEQVVLISEQPLKTNDDTYFTLRHTVGYLYAEQELNKISSIYGLGKGADRSKVFTYEIGDKVEGIETIEMKGSGARSLTAEDINELTGYDPTKNSSYGEKYYHSLYYPTMKTDSRKIRK